MKTSEQAVAYVDGACQGNPGPGAAAALVMSRGRWWSAAKALPRTTNNKMELLAVILALEVVRETKHNPARVTIVTDSKYFEASINKGWLDKWIRKDWKTAAGKPVANKGLWQRILKLKGPFALNVKWVKGHDGDLGNTLADTLASTTSRLTSSMRLTAEEVKEVTK